MAGLSGGTPADSGAPLELCLTQDVPDDGGLRVDLGRGIVLAVFRVGDEFLVVDNQCTHGSASLAEGEVEGEEIVCPYHLGRFNLRTGAATGPPCVDPIRSYAATVAGDRVYVSLSGSSTGEPATAAWSHRYDG